MGATGGEEREGRKTHWYSGRPGQNLSTQKCAWFRTAQNYLILEGKGQWNTVFFSSVLEGVNVGYITLLGQIQIWDASKKKSPWIL